MAKSSGVPFSNAQTHSEAMLAAYYADPARREAKAREALEAAIKRDAAASRPVADTLLPAERALRDFYDDPDRREAKAKKALEDAKRREEEAGRPPVDNRTPSEKKLAAFHADPDRREAKAAGALKAARAAEAGPGIGGILRGAGPIGAAIAPIVGVLSQVTSKFASIVGPTALLNQAMSLTISGFGTLEKSAKLVAAVIAPVFLPATILLSAGMSAISDILFTALQPAMQQWFELILSHGIPVLEQLVDAFSWVGRNAQELAFAFRAAKAVITLGASEIVRAFETDTTGDRGSKSARDAVDRSLAESLTSLRASLGPKASISSLGSVGQQAQLAALNNDPIEAKLMRRQIEILEQIEAEVRRQNAGGRGAPPSIFDPPPPGEGFWGTAGRVGGAIGRRALNPLGLRLF